jgi:polyisoprenoid-binding protein YceI
MSSRSRLLLVVVTVVVVAAGAVLWWFFDDDAPPEVTLGAAVESVTGDTTVETTEAGGVAGTWSVDAESGEFDYESATGTFAGFRIQEELASVGATTAVGRTGDVLGTVTIDDTTLTAATIEVDLTSITTNESRRDDRVQDALETETHPAATFTLTEAVDLGAGASDGGPVSVVAPGELTIRGVTRAVQFPLEAQLVGDTVVVVGALDVVFADYGVEVPESPAVLSVEDHGTLELQLLLVRS